MFIFFFWPLSFNIIIILLMLISLGCLIFAFLKPKSKWRNLMIHIANIISLTVFIYFLYCLYRKF